MNRKSIKIVIVGLVSALAIFIAQKYNADSNDFIANYELQKAKEANARTNKFDNEKISKRDRPDLAFIQEFEMTMDPNLGYPPTERQLTAFNLVKTKLKKMNTAKISGVTWTERGPSDVGGRTKTLMFDPNDSDFKKVWGGGVGGGLWYNDDITNSKSEWKAVDDLMANLAISSITYDPNNTSDFYLGTGLGYTSDIRGLGIWKSVDGGVNWDQLASTNNSDFHFVQKIIVTNTSVIASTTTGLFRSIDGGASWDKVLSGRFGDIELASNDVLFATEGVNSEGKIQRSSDDGINWENVTPTSNIGPQRIELTVAPSDPNVVYAVADGGTGGTDVAWFKKSTDGGDTWENIEIPHYPEQDCTIGSDHYTRGQAFYDLILGVHPTNPNILIAGGINIHKTTDGGLTWSPISYWTGGGCDDYVHADQHAMAFRPNHPNEAIFGNDGGVAYSANVGNSSNPEFEDRNNKYNVTTFYSCALENIEGSSYMLAGAQDNGTQQFSSVGFGNTREVTGGDGAYCFIDQDDSNFQITSYVYNSYRLSQDGGLTFTEISSDQNKGRFINPSEYDSETDILYGAGGINELSRITGITSTPSALEYVSVSLSDRQITTIKASPYTANRLFVGVRISTGEGLIFKIDNANEAAPVVTEITGTYSGSHGGWVSSIDVGSSDDQLLATFSNYGVSSVYETADGGDTWVDKNDNLPDMPVRWGLYNPNNRAQVLLATEVGVWSTDDITQTHPNWEPTNSGLANVRCDMLKYRQSDGTVAVATFGRGVYTTNIFALNPKVIFHTDQTVGYAGIPINFEDDSRLANNDWSWNFGDGSTSVEQNPQYTYASPGIYDVTLSIDGGVDQETKTSYITILPMKSAPYLLADGGDFETNPDDFTSKSLLNGINHWERGTPSNKLTEVNTGSNVWKTGLSVNVSDVGYDYSCALYTPAFDLSDDTKEYTVSFRLSMENGYCNLPQALQLQYSVDGGSNWYTLGSSQGEYEGTNWYNRGDNLGCSIDRSVFPEKIGWNATNVNGSDNTVQNVLTKYKLNSITGEPNVSFRFVSSVVTGISDDNNGSVYERDGFMIDDFELNVSEATAEFEADKTVTYVGQNIQFTYHSNGAQSFAWDFGDGTTTDVENPLHSYNEAGLYSVKLDIVNNVGTISKTNTDYILVLPNRSIPYTLEEGGDFDTNISDFGAQNIAGTPFELGVSSVSGKDGVASGDKAWVTGINEDEYLDNSEARFFTPEFSFNTLGTYNLEFKSKFSFEPNWDGFIVEYSTDLGQNWVKLNDTQEEGWYNTISDPQSVFGDSRPIFSGNTNGEFETFTTDVSFLYPNNSVIFRFLFLSDANTVDVGMAIDDFQLLGPEPGPAVADFTFEGSTGCTGQVVTFNNTSTGTIESLTWEFGPNADPTNAEGIGPHVVTFTSDVVTSSNVKLTAVSPVNGSVSTEKQIIIAPLFSPEPFSITYSGATEAVLTAPEADGYQWLEDGAIAEGETNREFIINDFNLTYSVLVSKDGCFVETGTQFVISGIGDELNNFGINLYPNPTSNLLYVNINNDYHGEVLLQIYDNNARVINLNKEVKSENSFVKIINLGNEHPGLYHVQIIFGNNKVSKQIIIK